MADLNNQWWRLRSKHGRGMLFSSPELMWEAACEFFVFKNESDYWKTTEVAYDKTLGEFKDKEYIVKPPFTWEGLCLYMGCGLAYFRQFKSTILKRRKANEPDETDEDFLTVINLIDQVITTQQLEGASAGKFNANITARYLGLKDQQQLSTPNEDGSDSNEFKVTLKIE